MSKQKTERSQGSFMSIKRVMAEFDWDKKKWISREFQDYGYRLAEELGDLTHKALYFKIAKETPRELLEQARSFVADANAYSKPRLFMWKLKKLKEDKKE
jgi:hypothetical protein